MALTTEERRLWEADVDRFLGEQYDSATDKSGKPMGNKWANATQEEKDAFRRWANRPDVNLLGRAKKEANANIHKFRKTGIHPGKSAESVLGAEGGAGYKLKIGFRDVKTPFGTTRVPTYERVYEKGAVERALQPDPLDEQRIEEVRQRMAPSIAMLAEDRQRYQQQFDALRNSPEVARQRAIAMGQSPTAAELAGLAQQQQVAKNIGAQASAAQGSAFNPAIARAALMQQSGLGQDMAARVAALASDERQQALNAAIGTQGKLLTHAQGQQQMGLAGDTALYGQRATQEGAGEAARSQAIGLKTGILDRAMGVDAATSANVANSELLRQQQQRDGFDYFTQAMNAGGAMLQGMGGMWGDSDIAMKKNIKKGDDAVTAFLKSLKPYEYEYKDAIKKLPIGGKGRHVSVMAQDLEKAGPVGKRMVFDTPVGKVVDYGKGLPAMLASLAEINRRLEKVEGSHG